MPFLDAEATHKCQMTPDNSAYVVQEASHSTFWKVEMSVPLEGHIERIHLHPRLLQGLLGVMTVHTDTGTAHQYGLSNPMHSHSGEKLASVLIYFDYHSKRDARLATGETGQVRARSLS